MLFQSRLLPRSPFIQANHEHSKIMGELLNRDGMKYKEAGGEGGGRAHKQSFKRRSDIDNEGI